MDGALDGSTNVLTTLSQVFFTTKPAQTWHVLAFIMVSYYFEYLYTY